MLLPSYDQFFGEQSSALLAPLTPKPNELAERWEALPRSRVTANPDMGDEVLLESHRAGSHEAFGVLLERYRRICMVIAARMLRDQTQAEDEVQTAFLKAYISFSTYTGQATFWRWLRRIVINQCLMQLRSERRRRTESNSELVSQAIGGPSPERVLGDAEIIEIARREVRRLPLPMHNAFRMVMLEGKSLRQCGVELGVTEASVKAHLVRAKKELRQKMRKHHGLMGAFTLLR